MPLLTSCFLGLGWPWVGELRRFHNIFLYVLPTQQNLVCLKHPNLIGQSLGKGK